MHVQTNTTQAIKIQILCIITDYITISSKRFPMNIVLRF